ncbi:unnamed protein product [Heligmosomoides polygyrus]|uniref:Transposase n=1 Tax=Heligmosomoides polygyrus TaxID=6339 RepID=A0A183GH79_HELPZ|nr:unnamed protein product [Heligmosomoides polygyrus]
MQGRHRRVTEPVRKSRNGCPMDSAKCGYVDGPLAQLVEAVERREDQQWCTSIRFRDSIISVERFDYRLKKIVVAAKERAYLTAPTAGLHFKDRIIEAEAD